MSVYSVPCWCFLDKAVAPVASADSPVRVLISSAFNHLFAPLVCRFVSLTRTADCLLTRIQASKDVLTFGRSCIQFWKNRLHLGEPPESDRRLTVLLDRVLTMPDVNSEGCSLSGEVHAWLGQDARSFGPENRYFGVMIGVRSETRHQR